MPIEIVGNTAGLGEIFINDLREMKTDFIEEADLKPYNGRERLIKKFSVSVNAEEFVELIEYYQNHPEKTIDVIKLNFSVHLNPGPEECNGIDYSDSLTIIAEAAKFNVPGESDSGHTAYDEVGDFVIIPAFKTANKNNWVGRNPCCPSSNP